MPLGVRARLTIGTAAGVLLLCLGGFLLRDHGLASTPREAAATYADSVVSGTNGMTHLKAMSVIEASADSATAKLTWSKPDGRLDQIVIVKHRREWGGLRQGWELDLSGSSSAR